MEKSEKESRLTALIRQKGRVRLSSILSVAVRLSIPAIMAQFAATAMEFIDAAMVGHLGADPAASIGLIATTTWLFMGVCSAASMGFSVQVAHLIGARKLDQAKAIARQSIIALLILSIGVGFVGVMIANPLPLWLGGTASINTGASAYFMIFALSIPLLQMNFLTNGLLRCSGNMAIPGIMGVLMCILDVVFNFFLIFPSRNVDIIGSSIYIPGFGLGVQGAALGTALAELVVTIFLLFYLWYANSEIRLSGCRASAMPTWRVIKRAIRIGFPMGVERFINSAAQITLTVIVAPLGAFAIAANAFAVTVEGLCYMPGFGIADAATTLSGQSLGGANRKLAKRFAWTTVFMGMSVMSIMGIVMYVAAPLLMELLTDVSQIIDLGVMALRIEAWAEPMYAASIVAYGVCVGAGDTLWPCIMNLGSMWGVRITLAALLAPTMGLKGVWLAMCIELCFRGAIFLIRLKSGKWMDRIHKL
ncbi:MAG: MATE family efflux transporter [Muribaculaceae bacterium]|nr:MATE family efflux transporter [Muribaculaceae bacterium]